jgi:chemotaxis methyl-accepting protein methylase
MSFEQFLREASSLLGLQWRPFRRRGIKRKIERRLAQIRLPDFEEYLLRIKEDPEERSYLSKILTVTISRFFRDREVFDAIGASVIPLITKNGRENNLRAWSIGCASGEEPYSLVLLWRDRFGEMRPQIRLSILATDIDENMLGRAKRGRYKKSSLREVPERVLRNHFKVDNDSYVLDQTLRENVEFRRHDIIREDPFLGFDIVFCRNLAFTYFSKTSQINVLKKIAVSLREEGYLAIGKEESLPLVYPTLFVPVFPEERIFQKFHPNVTFHNDEAS